MKNMKLILLAVVAMLCGSNINAQSLKIYKNDGTTISVPYSELDRIEAVAEEEQVSHEFVDLGLSVKWATCNIGAESPEEYGDFFAWGEIAPKDSYDGNNSVTNGIPMEDYSGNPEYDAATALWGGSARTPTYLEFEELIAQCSFQWTSQEGVSGMLVTGPNDNTIFLPAAGTYDGSNLSLIDQLGTYWSSTPFEDGDDRAYVIQLYFFGDYSTFWGYRKLGYPIRPVCD